MTRTAQNLLVGLMVICVAMLSACTVIHHAIPKGAAPATRHVATSGPTALSTSGFYLGVRELDAPPLYQPIAKFSAAVGRKPDIVLSYSGWKEPFEVRFASQLSAHGEVPLIQINPGSTALSAIAAGHDDAYLRSYARQVAAYGRPVIIGFAHEMNGWWYSWGYTHTAPRTWIAAWRHVVTVFRRQGANNVTWLWTVSSGSTAIRILELYWPGSRYVTWIGIDGYYYKRTKKFGRIFAPSIKAIRKFTHDPILLSEVAVGPVAGQARMIPNLFAGIRRYDLLGLVWYDVAQHAGKYHQDWRLEGHARALDAFRRGLAGLNLPAR